MCSGHCAVQVATLVLKNKRSEKHRGNANGAQSTSTDAVSMTRQVKLPQMHEVGQMSVKELMNVCKSYKVDIGDCSEKRELVS
mgnify:CR=1 FL=1